MQKSSQPVKPESEQVNGVEKEYRVDDHKLLAEWATEKKLIACDLHDDLVQLLVGSAMQLDSLSLAQDFTNDKTRKIVTGIRENLKEAIDQLREVIRSFSAATIEKPHLQAELEDLINSVGDRGIQIVCDLDDQLSQVNPLLAGSIYHVIREGLNNIIKHSGASFVLVNVELDRGYWIIQILDNGKGIQRQDLPPNVSLGLSGIGTRAAVFGGSANVCSSRISADVFCQFVKNLDLVQKAQRDATTIDSGSILRVDFRHQS